ncbi:MAG: cupin domain-containing protein [Negativicutes bacterium]|nr:cupin domain-containing protein [Negativicutes bacterium]
MTVKRTMKISEGIEFRKIGGYVLRLVNPATTGSKNIGTSMCYLNPGEEVVPHRHEYEEVYFILSGEGTMVLEDQTIRLEKNLSVYVPANALHGQKNDGEEPMAIYCSLSPAPKID